DRRTPTYTKPMLHQPGQPPRELNRLDIKNRTPLPAPLQDLVLEALGEVWPQVNALLVLDQVSEDDCGVVTARVREMLAELGERNLGKLILADSRERIRFFRSVTVKVNSREGEEALRAWGVPPPPRYHAPDVLDAQAVREFAGRFTRPVFCTIGIFGTWVANP